jgi:hypothetical protein
MMDVHWTFEQPQARRELDRGETTQRIAAYRLEIGNFKLGLIPRRRSREDAGLPRRLWRIVHGAPRSAVGAVSAVIPRKAAKTSLTVRRLATQSTK